MVRKLLVITVNAVTTAECILVLSACSTGGNSLGVGRPQAQGTSTAGADGEIVKLRARAQAEAARYGVAYAEAPAPPFDGPPSLLKPDSTQQSNRFGSSTLEPPRFFKSRPAASTRSKSSAVGTYDSGGQGQIYIPGGNGYIGIYSINSAYQPSQISLQPGNDPQNPFNTLYAPTTKAGDGGRIFDFCTGGGAFVLSKNIDSAFAQAYVRYFLGGQTPQYTTEIKLLSDGRWHSLLYNYNTNGYEDLYSVAGRNYFNGGEAWDLFETHYATGPCSSPPQIEASGIRVQSPDGSWSLVTTANAFTTAFGDCMNTTISPFSSFYATESNSHFVAISY